MGREVLGVAAAVAASALYSLSVALQALEARRVPKEHALRISLLRRLVRRPRWVAGTAVGLLGWPLQAAALLAAPLTLVQPALAVGLVLLLVIASRLLDEHVGRREALAALLVVAGLAALAVVAPERTAAHAGGGRLALVLGGLAAGALAPYAYVQVTRTAPGALAALAAGLAFAWTGVSTKLAADALALRQWVPLSLWVAATAAAGALATLSEMTALQRARATAVAPIVFSAETLAPVLLAPLVAGEGWSGTPLGGAAIVAAVAAVAAGGVALARSPALEASGLRAGPVD
jgi:Magnesium transporter NIPA